jgi:hypothetical protein
MATTTKILSRVAATTNTATVLYTVPASTTAVVTNIVITNTASTSATFTLAMGPSAGQISMFTTTTLAANSTAFFDLKQVLATTNTITGGASATTVNFHISGVEIS